MSETWRCSVVIFESRIRHQSANGTVRTLENGSMLICYNFTGVSALQQSDLKRNSNHTINKWHNKINFVTRLHYSCSMCLNGVLWNPRTIFALWCDVTWMQTAHPPLNNIFTVSQHIRRIFFLSSLITFIRWICFSHSCPPFHWPTGRYTGLARNACSEVSTLTFRWR